MMPARYRGRIDIAVNGTYWAGALIGTTATLVLLNHLPPDLGWRTAFFVGPALGLCIILVRRHLPESPRWQIMHGREEEAEASIAQIEAESDAGADSSPRWTRARRSRSSRPSASATCRWSGCCSRTTRTAASWSPR